MNDLGSALILGLVEGATEFVPVSSTGHLILVGHAIGFSGQRAALFEVAIQLGAILAVVWQYRSELARWTYSAMTTKGRSTGHGNVIAKLALAFLPSACVGLLVHRWVTQNLFSPPVVAWAMIGGGVAILVIERLPIVATMHDVECITTRTAIGVGIAQLLSLIPGVSRSGATIMAAVTLGVTRAAAAEFSFLLAIPVMFAATGLGAIESASIAHRGDALMFAVGFLTAFVSALIALRLLLRYVSTHSFAGFAWYRIVLGTALVILFR